MKIQLTLRIIEQHGGRSEPYPFLAVCVDAANKMVLGQFLQRPEQYLVLMPVLEEDMLMKLLYVPGQMLMVLADIRRRHRNFSAILAVVFCRPQELPDAAAGV